MINSLQTTNQWPKVVFGDVVRNVDESVRDPQNSGLERYVGLEHIAPESLHIQHWGLISEGTSFTRRFHKGQVLFGKRRAYQRKVAVAEFDGLCSSDILVFEPKDERLLSELLPFICQSDGFFEHAMDTSAGSLSPRTKFKELARYEFPLPPLDEQRRIAEILWAVDETVYNYSRALQKMILFAKITTDSIMENITKRYKSVKLSDVCEIPISNGIFKTREEFGKGYLLVNVTNIYEDFRVNLDKLDRVNATDNEIARFSVIPSDLIFNRSSIMFSGVGWACLIPETSETMLFECHLMRVRPNKELIDPAFLTRYSLSCLGRRFIESVARMTTMTTINQQDLGNMPIPQLSLDEQKSIGKNLDNLAEKIIALQDHINTVKIIGKIILNERIFAPGVNGDV